MYLSTLINRQGTLLVVASTLFIATAFPAKSAIQGSVHDFTTYAWSGGEICVVCHAPHGSPVANAPLWNHSISTATYTLYSSPSMYATPEQPAPGSISRLCLSCHDGTTAVDSFGSNPGTVFIDDINPNVNLGTDLSNDHPVGTMWLHQEQVTNCTNCHEIQNNMEVTVVKFYDRKIECGTCHDVHNDVPNPKLLRLPMAGSQLCFTCHGK